MDFASPDIVRVVTHNVVHLRAKPSNDAERVSQLLLGQMVHVLHTENGWARVQGEDTYRGWCDLRWLTEDTTIPASEIATPFAELRTDPDANAPLLLRLSIACRVHHSEEQRNGFVRVRLPGGRSRIQDFEERPSTLVVDSGWLPASALEPRRIPGVDEIGETIAEIGREFLGTPYLWGGSSAFGLDCSGFVQLCYHLVGITLRRDADIQRDDPRFVPVVPSGENLGREAEWEALRPGDLVFFGKPDRITHVGIHFAGNTFIHSAGGAGVILTQWGDLRYSPGYVDARRLDPAQARERVTRYEADNR